MKRLKSWIEKIIELGNIFFDKKDKKNMNENKMMINQDYPKKIRNKWIK